MKLFLFGAGKIAERFTTILSQLSVEIYGYVDNNPSRWGSDFLNAKVYSPDILKDEKDIFITVACAAVEDVTIQLSRMGLQSKIISIDRMIKEGISLTENGERNVNSLSNKVCGKNNVILDNLDGSWGGAEDWVHKLASCLLACGYSITVIENAVSKTGSVDEQIILRLDKLNHNIFMELVENLMKKKPFTLVNVWCSEVLWAAAYIKKLYPKEVKIFSSILNDQNGFYQRQKEWDRFIDSYLCISSRIKNNLIKVYGIKEEKVYYKEPFVEYRERERRQYHIKYDQPLRIGYPCRLSYEQKRADLIPELIEDLERKDVNYNLNIAGDGPYEDKIRKYVENKGLNKKVKLHGRLTREKLLEFLDTQDIYLNISEYEGASLTMLEAMAGGCVPVVTNVSGVEDFIRNRKNGLISEIGDITSVSDNIFFLDKNRKMLEEYGKECVRIVSQKCDLERYIDYIVNLII